MLDFYTRQPDGSYPFDASRSNAYEYIENQQALYASYSNEAGQLEYQIGVRAENTTTGRLFAHIRQFG